MKFAIAVHGTRGDVEPCAAVGRELVRRGHQVDFAVPPNLLGFAEKAGLPALPYGVDSQEQLDANAFRQYWKIRNPATILRELRDYITQGWAEMNETLTGLADGADLILTGTTYQEVAANVAEYYDIPLAALHYFPARANTQVLPVPLPPKLVRTGWAVAEWVHWHALKEAEDAQRRALGLPKARVRAVRRIVESGALEIQAYDPLFFPGLSAEWGERRPLIGSMTLQLPTESDADVMSWIDAGTPPIYFGFGSMPVENPIAAIEMIVDVTARLGERALINSGVWDLGDVAAVRAEHVRVVGSANHAAIFPRCRVVVHHGGAGTTAASVRAGVPTLVIWVGADQPFWGKQVKRLGIGGCLRFSKLTRADLEAELRHALSPECAEQARKVAGELIDPARSVTTAADLLENAVRTGGRRITR
ncbi:glycosyltransferase [Mycolicibacterium phlei]|jgi:UDP:flavonoid glycosyltransferase YjiC (YdhE family)|uniref:glycosyltransferase n=1 Tax=Mycolicibacterium phlei TaxID=1771 RepID=UPI0037C78C8A